MVGNDKVQKYVLDLGIAAYLLMHGHQVIGKQGKAIYFECSSLDEADEFDKLTLDYQPPNDFYTFDSCLMFLKKINECGCKDIEKKGYKTVSDLGVAAYLLMHEYKSSALNVKVMGRKGKFVYFDCPESKDAAFENLSFQYFPSQFHAYDSCLMSLKKVNEHMPR
jgi:hypothetical protein